MTVEAELDEPGLKQCRHGSERLPAAAELR
jgi:hypothetical protein